MNKQKKFHWFIIFVVLLSFSFVSVQEIMRSGGTEVALAGVVQGASDQVNLLFTVPATATRTRVSSGTFGRNEIRCEFEYRRQADFNLLFSGRAVEVNGELVASFTADELQQPVVRSLIDNITEDMVSCQSFEGRRRIPLFSIFHIS